MKNKKERKDMIRLFERTLESPEECFCENQSFDIKEITQTYFKDCYIGYPNKLEPCEFHIYKCSVCGKEYNDEVKTAH